MNQQYKQSMFEYGGKIDMAVATDDQISSKFNANKDGFSLLSKTRQELAAMIPQSANTASIGNDPAVVAIKEQISRLEECRLGKEKVMQDGMAMHDSINAVEELMKVNQGTASKGDVFESFKAKYMQHFAQSEAIE